MDFNMPNNSKRVMFFVDGENLVFSYQKALEAKFKPHHENKAEHYKNVFVWNKQITRLAFFNEIYRVTYYTSAVGSDEKIKDIVSRIKGLKFDNPSSLGLPNSLKPVVFKKDKQSRKSKGVDIQMTTDILSHVYNNTLDIVVIVSGDGDYEPLIEEISRQGKIVYVAALSHGLNEKLKVLADEFIDLDHIFFHQDVYRHA